MTKHHLKFGYYNLVINELETQQKATDNDFSDHTYVNVLMQILPEVGLYTMPRQNIDNCRCTALQHNFFPVSITTDDALWSKMLVVRKHQLKFGYYNHVINELETRQKAIDNDFSDHTCVKVLMQILPQVVVYTTPRQNVDYCRCAALQHNFFQVSVTTDNAL